MMIMMVMMMMMMSIRNSDCGQIRFKESILSRRLDKDDDDDDDDDDH